MAPNRLEVNYTKAGRVMLTARSQVSFDWMTMTVIVNGTDMLGKPLDAIAVYFKQ